MSVKKLVLTNRSCRRFHQNRTVSPEVLEELVDVARICPSAANRQPLKYIISNSPGTNELIFKRLGWAAYMADWPGPGADNTDEVNFPVPDK